MQRSAVPAAGMACPATRIALCAGSLARAKSPLAASATIDYAVSWPPSHPAEGGQCLDPLLANFNPLAVHVSFTLRPCNILITCHPG